MKRRTIRIGINGKSLSKDHPGGAVRVALCLINQLQIKDKRFDFMVYIFSPDPKGVERNLKSISENVTIVPAFTIRLRDPISCAAWEQCILPFYASSFRCDVLLNLVNSFPILTFGVPQLNLVHDVGFLNRNWFRGLFSYYLKIINTLSPPDAFTVTVSNDSAKSIREKFRRDSITIHNGIELPETEYSSLDECRRDTLPFCLFIGSINPRKNLENLLQAWRILNSSDRRPPILKVAGASKAIFLDTEVSEIPNVQFLGFVSDEEKWRLLRECECLILPSHFEGFGLPIAEAFSVGKPVFASDLPVFHELFGDLPIYFDTNSSKEIANCISLRFGENGQIIDLGDGNLRRAVARSYTWAKAGEKYRELICLL